MSPTRPQSQGKRAVGKRATARAATEKKIIEAAERQLAEVGASGISLRKVAQDVGMAPSALYRYYNGIDQLYTAMIIRAFNEQTAAVQAAFDAHATPPPTTWDDTVELVVLLAMTLRQWALDNPHKYALIYGTPVPGYKAPQDTIPPAAGVGRIFAASCVYLTDGVVYDPMDYLPEYMASIFVAIYGVISFELFGHLVGVVDDPAVFLRHTVENNLELLRSHFPGK